MSKLINVERITTQKKRLGLGAVLVASAAPAFAETGEIDITAVTSTINNGVATVSAIGLAVLSLVVVIKVFKWARSAM